METPRDPYKPQPEQRKKREGLWLLLLLLLIGGGIAWYMVGNSDDTDAMAGAPNGALEQPMGVDASGAASVPDGDAADAPKPTSTADGRCIVGLSQTNVLDELKQRNFRVDTLGADRFRAVRKTFGADYEVTVVTDGTACVHDLNAWVKADGVLKNAQATQDFFELFAALPLEGSNPDSMMAWMNDNSLLPEASIEHGNTRFTMAAPDRNTRVLRVLSSDVVVARR